MPTHACAPTVLRITGLLHSDDTQVMLEALQQLRGISFAWEDDGATLVVDGGDGALRVPDRPLHLGNAGTAARFLTTVCTLVRSTSDDDGIVLTGSQRMQERPIGPLVDALMLNGKCTSPAPSPAFPPLPT